MTSKAENRSKSATDSERHRHIDCPHAPATGASFFQLICESRNSLLLRGSRVLNALRLNSRNIDNSSQDAVCPRHRPQPRKAVVMPFPYRLV